MVIYVYLSRSLDYARPGTNIRVTVPLLLGGQTHGASNRSRLSVPVTVAHLSGYRSDHLQRDSGYRCGV